MRFRHSILFCALLLLLVAGFSLLAQRKQDRNKYFRTQNSRNISDDVQQAKSKGISEIHIPLPKVTLSGAANINEVVRADSVVYAKLIDKQSTFYDNDNTMIVTWLRFNVITPIAGPSVPPEQPLNGPDRLKRDFLPSYSFLVRVFGGTLYQDGVKVVSDSSVAELPVGETFVLFTYFDPDRQDALAGFNFGPESILHVDSSGRLSTGPPSSPHVITRFISDNNLKDLGCGCFV